MGHQPALPKCPQSLWSQCPEPGRSCLHTARPGPLLALGNSRCQLGHVSGSVGTPVPLFPSTRTPHTAAPRPEAGPVRPGDSGDPSWRKDQRRVSRAAHAFISTQGGEGSRGRHTGHIQAGGAHLLLAAIEHQDDRRGPRRLPLPPRSAPATLPGSFSHLGTFPRSLLTGWATPGLGSERPTAPASAAGSDSRGAGSGAGIGGGVPAALDMHLRAKGRGTGRLA